MNSLKILSFRTDGRWMTKAGVVFQFLCLSSKSKTARSWREKPDACCGQPPAKSPCHQVAVWRDIIVRKQRQLSMIGKPRRDSRSSPRRNWTELAITRHVTKTNILIDNSRNKDQFHKIEVCASDLKRKWAVIKASILQQVSQQVRQMRINQELPSMHPFSVIKLLGRPSSPNLMVSFRSDARWQTIQRTRALQPDTWYRRWGSETSVIEVRQVVASWFLSKILTPGVFWSLHPQSSLGWQTLHFCKVRFASFKMAQVTPLLKKVELDASDSSNHK